VGTRNKFNSPDVDNLILEQRHYEGLFCGCVFVSPDVAVDRCAWLDDGIFVDEKYGKYWKGVKEHGDAIRSAVDTNLTSELSRYLSEIQSSLYPEEYARAILKFDYLRKASESSQKIMLGIIERDDCAVRSAIDSISETRLSMSDIDIAKTPADINTEFIDCITSISPSIMTGIEDLDKQMGGLFMGELTIVAARPGVGKTSLAMAIAQNVAYDQNNENKKVLVFSLEMSRIQLWARMACAKAGIPWKLIRSGRAAQEFIDKAVKSSNELQGELEGRLFIEDETWDVPGMINIAAKLRPDLCVIDHLGEIRWGGDEQDELKWFGRATKIIRAEISRRLNCHTILVHQLNRGVEGRQDKRPVLSDLRWSGDLEQLADVVLMLYREDYYDEKAQKLMSTTVPIELWTRKNRQGIMNACSTLNFNVEQQRFYPADSGNLQIIDKVAQKWYDT